MKEKITKNKNYIFIAILICIIGIISISLYKEVSAQLLKENLKDITWVRNKVNIKIDNNLEKNIYKVTKNKNISIFQTVDRLGG